MKDNSSNNNINFQANLINTDLGEKLAKFKLYNEFLSNALIYIYQANYSTNNLPSDEIEKIKEKYSEIKVIMDEALEIADKKG